MDDELELHNIILNARELRIVIRALERMKSELEHYVQEEPEARAYETQQMISLMTTSLFKFRAAENR